MDDVLEFRSETKSPYFSALNNNNNNSLNRTLSGSPVVKTRNSASLTRKSLILPPIESNSSSLTNSTSSGSQTQKSTNDLIGCILKEQEQYTILNTENKKRAPEKLELIDHNLVLKSNSRDLDTPLIIDILSESGRLSKQSLEPLTARDSKLNSRPNSCKETLFRKPSAKLRSIHNFVSLDSMIKMSNNEKLIVDDLSEIMNDSRLIECDDKTKLDTIKENLIESKNLSIKKDEANVNESKKKAISSILKKVPVNNLNVNKPPSNFACSAQSNLKKQNDNNLAKKNFNQKIGPSKPVYNSNNSQIKSRSQSVEKPISKPINNLKVVKTNPNINKVNKPDPTRLDSSRIEKNKKLSAASSNCISSSANKEADIFAESFQSTLTNVTSASKSTLYAASNDLRLEINSSRINLYEKPLSAKSNLSMTSSKIGEPKQPLILTMFEGYPQPYSVMSNGNLNSESAQSKSKPTSSKPNSSKKQSTNNKNLKYPKPNSGLVRQKTKINNLQSNSKQKSTQNKTKSSKIIINLSNQNLDNNLQSEIEKSLSKENDDENIYYNDEDFDNDLSSSSSNSIDYLSENDRDELKDLPSINESKQIESETDLNSSKSLLINMTASETILNQTEKGDLTNRINKDFVKSFEDRVFAIYSKYDHLLTLQENKLDTKENFEQKKELNDQKAQFSEEIAKELKENINFEQEAEVKDPELLNRLKQLYNLVKYNSSSENLDKSDILVDKPPIIPTTTNQAIKKDDSYNLNRKNSLSIKSNADIREVYSIVNSITKTNSYNQNTNTAEITIKSDNKFALKYKIPVSLSDKINTLMISMPHLDDDNNKSSQNDKQINNENNNKEQFKNNKLDSVGNESISSASPDSNSISYHYDVKYRNEISQSPINLQFENENDFKFRWKRGNLLGKGAFGSVYQAMLSTGEIIAVKQIEMEESDPGKARKEYDSVREEVKILRELEHLNIVQFMGTMLDGNIVNIFMELIPGGTVEALLKTFGPFEEDLFKIFTNQILEGVNYIHSRNVVHRDIKGKNIMLMSSGIIKLIDFGCAKRLKKNQSSNSIKHLLKSLKGTPYWMSPEVIRETGHGSKADIWSIGATIFEMATGLPPWGELSPLSAIYAIGSGESPPPELPDKFSNEAKSFVKNCLIRDPELRPSAADLLNHEFLKPN